MGQRGPGAVQGHFKSLLLWQGGQDRSPEVEMSTPRVLMLDDRVSFFSVAQDGHSPEPKLSSELGNPFSIDSVIIMQAVFSEHFQCAEYRGMCLTDTLSSQNNPGRKVLVSFL